MSPMLKRCIHEKAFWVLILLGVLYFYHPLFLGKLFFFRDLGYDFVPQKRLFAEIIGAGDFPLWDKYRHGGQPYLADLNNSTLYPTNLLYSVFPFFKAFSINIAIHLICALGSAYLFSRVLGLCSSASCFSAVIYGFSGYSLSLINLHGRFLAIALLPLMYLGWHLYLLDKTKQRWFILTVFVGVCQVFAGAPEVNVLTLLSLVGWSLFFPYPNCSSFQKVKVWLLLGMCIFGISSIQLIPTLEMSVLSARGDGIEFAVFSQWSLYPGRLGEFIIPGFFGYADTLPFNEYYWGGNLGDRGYPYILNIYVGCIALAFALVGGVSSKRDHILPRNLRYFLLGTLFLSFGLSLGRYLPFFRVIYAIPFMTLFRYPVKFLIGGLFPLALLAGHTAHCYAAYSPGRKVIDNGFKKLPVIFLGLTCLLGLFSLLFHFSKTFVQRFFELFFQRSPGEISYHNLKISFFQAVAICLVVTLLLYYRRVKTYSWQPWALVCVLVVDLLFAGRRINFYAPEIFFTNVPAIVHPVRQRLGDGRLFRTTDPLPSMIYVEPQDIFSVSPDHVMWLYRWNLEVLHKYLASYYNIPVIFHQDYDLLAQKYLVKLTHMIEQVPWKQRLPLLSAGNVTVIISSDKVVLADVERLAAIPNRGRVSLSLYQNHRAMGAVALVPMWKTVTSDDEALQWMLMAGYDPRKHTVIQVPEMSFFPFWQASEASTLIADNMSDLCQGASEHTITQLETTPFSTRYVVAHSCDEFLVFSEPFYPGWSVLVDGRSVPVMRANMAFSAIFLPKGRYEVERRYRPYSFMIGIACSLTSCIGLLIVSIRRKRRAC